MNRFFTVIPILLFLACGNQPKEKQAEVLHPALSNPIVKPFTDAIALDSTNATLYFQRAEKLFDLKMSDLVEKDLATAVRLAPENLNYKAALAAILIEQEKGTEALKTIKEIQLKDKHPDYIRMEAEAYMADKKYEAAEPTTLRQFNCIKNCSKWTL